MTGASTGEARGGEAGAGQAGAGGARAGAGAVYDRGGAVCVIGAGSAGLTTVKNLRDHGFEVDCYERETGVGGSWNHRHDRSPVYAGAHLISSRPFSQFPDFPMPDAYPDFPDHRRMLAYLSSYADHFGLRDHIWFGTEVVSVRATGSTNPDHWEVTVRGTGGGPSRTLRYAAVVVCNGTLWNPHHVEFPGQDTFGGEIIHAVDYNEPSQLRGKRVLVVGAGNTGCDIAVDGARHADRVWHSTRRGYWYTPKYVFGEPADQANERFLAMRAPMWLRRAAFRTVMRASVGKLERFGLPAPDHKPLTIRPVVNSLITYHLGHGDITPAPDVARFEPHQVVFSDDSTADPQLVILATGYRPRFEFLPDDYLGGDPARPRLYLRMFNPAYPTFAAVGLVHPDSGLMGVLHWQSVLVARLLAAREDRPAAAGEFSRLATRDLERWRGRAGAHGTGGHIFDVDRRRYLALLERSLRMLEATP